MKDTKADFCFKFDSYKMDLWPWTCES